VHSTGCLVVACCPASSSGPWARRYLGCGAHSRIRTAGIPRLSEDLPVVVEIVDEAAGTEALLPC
jgi:PII-like signaling protein